MSAQHIRVGQIGEEIARKYLLERGFYLLDRNFRQKWGEIDLIVHKGVVIHFVEVKTFSYETKLALEHRGQNGIRPEENLTSQKYHKLARTIESWVAKESYKGHYQLDLVTVHLVSHERYAQVEYYEKIFIS